jgi:hypothetical protein
MCERGRKARRRSFLGSKRLPQSLVEPATTRRQRRQRGFDEASADSADPADLRWVGSRVSWSGSRITGRGSSLRFELSTMESEQGTALTRRDDIPISEDDSFGRSCRPAGVHDAEHVVLGGLWAQVLGFGWIGFTQLEKLAEGQAASATLLEDGPYLLNRGLRRLGSGPRCQCADVRFSQTRSQSRSSCTSHQSQAET